MNQHIRDTRTQRKLTESYIRTTTTKDILKEILKRCKDHSEKKRKDQTNLTKWYYQVHKQKNRNDLFLCKWY